MLMLPQDQVATGVWQLLEQIYVDSAGDADRSSYSLLSDDEKRAILTEFAKKQAAGSKRWTDITHNLLSAELNQYNYQTLDESLCDSAAPGPHRPHRPATAHE
jgi:hypothetical protein